MHQLMAFSILYVVREVAEKDEKGNDATLQGKEGSTEGRPRE